MEQRFKTDPPSRHNFQVSIRRLKSSGSRIGSTTVTPESSRTSLDTKWRFGHRSPSMVPPSRSWSTGRGDLFDMLNPTERERFIARNNSGSHNGLVRLSSVNRAMHANDAKKQLKCGSIQGPGSSESSGEEGFRQKCKELEVDCGNLIHVIPSRCNNELSKVQEKQNQLQNFGNEGRMPSWRKQTMQNKQKREKVAKDSFLEVYSNRKNDFSANDMKNTTPQTPSPGMSPQTQARNTEPENNFSNCRWNGLYTSANSSQHQRSKPTFTIPLNSNKNINNQPPPTTMRGNRQSAEEVDTSSIRRRTGTEQATMQRSRQRASLVPIGSRCPLDGRESSNGRIAVANVTSVFNECAAAMKKKSVAQTDPDIKFTTSKTSLQQLEKSMNGVLSPSFSTRCITVEQTHRTDSRKDKDDEENHPKKETSVMRLLDSQQSTETGSRSKVTSSRIHSPNQQAALDKLCASSVSPRRCNLALGIRIMGRNAQTLMSSLKGVLESKGIYYTHVNPYRMQCTATIPQGGSNKIAGTVKWESEIVQLPRLRTYGVRFKYTAGDNSHYRYFEKMITEQFPRADD
ncbi:unnamed protein product [Dicrocoelium dendriticum]|nr:unnamed protein product [Dicrocoelium dendriticum]